MSDINDLNDKTVSDVSALQINTTGRIAKVTRLEVRFEIPGVESKKIYANGRMQTRVLVFVEAQDENGDPVSLPYFPDLISARLIHFDNGKPLEREVYTGKPLVGWSASSMENKYAHEMPGGFATVSVENYSSGRSEPLIFWVSSSEVSQRQIAVEVTLQGKVYKSNNATNPDGKKINSSVLIVAQPKATFSPDQFIWQSERVGGERPGETLYRYHLGLYPGSRQFKLVSWESSKYNPKNRYPVEFCNTGSVSGVKGVKSFVGEFPSPYGRAVQVNMPLRQYLVDINMRSGELTVVQGVSASHVMGGEIRVGEFPFTVIDEYGNDHKLSIGIDVSKVAFVLRRG